MSASLARAFTALGRAILHFPTAPWEDALSHGQMQSKAWAVEQLGKLRRDLGLVYLVGGWLGLLPLLMFESSLKFRKIRSFDIDPSCAAIADQVNIEHVISDWRFKAITKDMHAINYAKHDYQIPLPKRKPVRIVESCDTVINTCCDHLSDFAGWWARIPKGKLVLLQNNDYQRSDHVNAIPNLGTMRQQAPMSRLLFRGELGLAKYQRFMLIGVK